MNQVDIPDVLAELNAAAYEDMQVRRSQVPASTLEKIVSDLPEPIDPIESFSSPGISIIAEVKRQSPSKGQLASIPDPASLASQYEKGGAHAISVLTQRHKFGGSLADLDQVRKKVDLPVLRKDFIVDEYMLLEARVHGADLVLLIVASLPEKQLARLYQFSLDLGLTPLVEVHTEEETKIAVGLGAKLIGVNNRNLKTLTVDRQQFGRLVDLIPEDRIRVAESGLRNVADVVQAHQWGANVVLIGETLVRSSDAGQTIQDIIKKVGY